MRKVFMFLGAALAICLAVVSNPYAQASDQPIIKCAGADSMLGRIHTAANHFMTDNPNVKVEVAKGETVDVGILALLNKKADVAMASRRINKSEKEEADKRGLKLSETLIGYGGIVFLTHNSNPLGALTVDQVQRILRGEYANWKELGGSDQPIVVFRSDITHPGTLIFMQDDFLGGAKFAEKSIQKATFPEILREVSKNPGAIGYVRIRDAFEAARSAEEVVKILAIKTNADAPAVMPSRETVGNGTYAIKRPYYLYCDSNANEAVKKFVDFVAGRGWGPLL